MLPRTTLVAVGPPPAKLERVLTSVQLECGISVRRVLNVAELAELLAALGGAPGRPPPACRRGPIASHHSAREPVKGGAQGAGLREPRARDGVLRL